MKNLFTLFAIVISAIFMAQAPNLLSYQAVVRNAANQLVINQNVGVKFSILKSSATGAVVYAETQNSTTNSNGLFTTNIGSGTVISGSMASINWANDVYFIKSEIDLAGGSNYTITGTQQLLSVPYALNAKNGIPNGGTTGQVLSKIDGTDFNTQWVTPANTGWGLTGNTGTNTGTNFIGTTDNVGLSFRTNNVDRWAISPKGRLSNTSALGAASVFIVGGNENTTGDQNTAIGFDALKANTTGGYNLALGDYALQFNTTGNANTVLGSGAMVLSATANNNVAIGRQALEITTAGDNTAVGAYALKNNTTGNRNTAIGTSASTSAGNLFNTTAIGFNAIVNESNKIRLGDDFVTKTDIAGQVKVNAQSTSGNFTLPVSRGTANQVLQTDGVGGTQWVTPSAGGSGASVQLFANKVGGSGETLPLATSASPTTIVFNNVVNAPTLGSYNNTTGVFTVGTTGAGTYLIQVKLITNDNPTNATNTPPIFITLIKNNATYGTNGADVLYGDYPTLQNVLPANMKGQGSLTKVVQLAAGDTFRIVAVGANSSTAAQPIATVAGSNITIIKL